MATKYKVSDYTAQMIDSLRYLYKFYDEFYTLFEGDPSAGGKAIDDDFHKKFHELNDCVLLILAYRLEDALIGNTDGLTKPEVEF